MLTISMMDIKMNLMKVIKMKRNWHEITNTMAVLIRRTNCPQGVLLLFCVQMYLVTIKISNLTPFSLSVFCALRWLKS